MVTDGNFWNLINVILSPLKEYFLSRIQSKIKEKHYYSWKAKLSAATAAYRLTGLIRTNTLIYLSRKIYFIPIQGME